MKNLKKIMTVLLSLLMLTIVACGGGGGNLLGGSGITDESGDGDENGDNNNPPPPSLAGSIHIAASAGGTAITSAKVNETLYAVYSGSEAGITYQWNKDGSAVVSGGTGASYTPDTAGSYTVRVNAAGYTGKGSAAVSVSKGDDDDSPYAGVWRNENAILTIAEDNTFFETTKYFGGSFENFAQGKISVEGTTITIEFTDVWANGQWNSDTDSPIFIGFMVDYLDGERIHTGTITGHDTGSTMSFTIGEPSTLTKQKIQQSPDVYVVISRDASSPEEFRFGVPELPEGYTYVVWKEVPEVGLEAIDFSVVSPTAIIVQAAAGLDSGKPTILNLEANDGSGGPYPVRLFPALVKYPPASVTQRGYTDWFRFLKASLDVLEGGYSDIYTSLPQDVRDFHNYIEALESSGGIKSEAEALEIKAVKTGAAREAMAAVLEYWMPIDQVYEAALIGPNAEYARGFYNTMLLIWFNKVIDDLGQDANITDIVRDKLRREYPAIRSIY